MPSGEKKGVEMMNMVHVQYEILNDGGIGELRTCFSRLARKGAQDNDTSRSDESSSKDLYRDVS